ncbi:MAG: prepilin-type N-terminal cleavage/methylation domain-containing protein [Myxococcales bacterium]|nr:prepilin-type N-terminal cleavage/methylation domain-containing protein [Myxococcales bacterium]
MLADSFTTIRAPKGGIHRRGVTLIEMIVVLAIVAAVLASAVVSMSVIGSTNLGGDASRLATTFEFVYGRAALNGIRYRLVIDLDTNEYWAECTPDDVAIADQMSTGSLGNDTGQVADSELERGARDRFQRYDDDEDEGDIFNLNLNQMFDDCSEPLLERRSLRNGIEFAQVMTTHQTEPYLAGQATVAFFPNGFVEPTIIWIRQTPEGDESEEDAPAMTLFVKPMTGSIRIERGMSEVPRDFHDVEEDR